MKKFISAFLSTVMLLSCVQVVSAEVRPKTVFPEVGEDLYGYTVTEKGYYDEAQADTVVLHHNYSGADILCMQNSDPNLAFDICYKTPNTDESDRNHVFEHAIITSSKKYPSDDIFFDIANRTFNSYVNAHTMRSNTAYDLASMSEAQLEKMIDVYLSCMVDPGILTNKNIFKREALNYTLESRDADIEMGGTVYSEDMGYMNHPILNAEGAIMETLYPGEVASNMVAQAEHNYKDLTYEHTIELYKMCYHFDNSLIVLYGDMDYDRILKFMDDEYLSKYPDNHTDLSAYAPVPSQKAHTDTTVYSPAFEGDSVEGATVLTYAFDLYGLPEKDVLKYMLLAEMFGKDNSPIRKKLDEAGMGGDYMCMIDTESIKPYLCIIMPNCDENQKAEFKRIIESGIEEVAQNGFGDFYDTYFELSALESSILVGDREFGINVSIVAEGLWTIFDDPNGLSKYTEAKTELKNDKEQTEIKRLCAGLLGCENTAVIAVVPRPGDAEKVLAETQDYLKEMKANMTDEQLDAMIAETKAYNEWLENQETNNNVSVAPELLPGYEPLPEVKTSLSGGIKTYSVDIGKNAGRYQVIFDASNISKNDIYWAELYKMLVGELGTDVYTRDEITQKKDELLYKMEAETVYDQNAGESKPSLKYKVSWYGYPNKYRGGLELMLNMLQNSDFTDAETIKTVIESKLPDFDAARSTTPIEVAKNKAIAPFGEIFAYTDYVKDEGYYNFLSEQLDRLENEKGYADTLAGKLGGISKKIVRRDNISAVIMGSKSAENSIKKVNKDVLNKLPSVKGGGNTYDFETAGQKSAYIGEYTSQYTVNMVSVDDNFPGEYIPFINYINDVYTVPVLRYKNGAYSAASRISLSASTKRPFIMNASASDPNVGLTLDVIDGIKDVLPDAEITQEQLDDYITSAYSTLFVPENDYAKAKTALIYKMRGVDSGIVKDLIDGVRNAKVSDKDAAAAAIKDAIERSATVTVGNSNAINAEKDAFDSVKDMRKN